MAEVGSHGTIPSLSAGPDGCKSGGCRGELARAVGGSTRSVRGQLWTQADWGWPGPTAVGLASTVGLAMDGPISTVGPLFLAMYKGHIFGSIKLANVLGIKLLLCL